MEATIAPGGTIQNVVNPQSTVAMYHSGRRVDVREVDVEAFAALGFSVASEEVDRCPECNAQMGRLDRSDGPGDRWGCAACGGTYCQKCYRSGVHVCTPTPIDAARFTDEA